MGIQPRHRPAAPPGREFTHDPRTPMHTPQRPAWLCKDCGEPWPCEPKRDQLTSEAAESAISSTAVYVYMSSHLHDALDELPDVPHGELWVRFLGWVRTGTRNRASDPGTP